jgi:Zn-dependent M28 family amino/carboxypeptidase
LKNVRRSAAATIASLALVAAAAPTAHAAPEKGANNNTVRKLTQAVSAEGILEHLRALQAIADRNGGTRVSGSEGYDESAEYAADVLRDAGYDVEVQEFTFNTFRELAPTVFRQLAPGDPRDLPAVIMSYSGSGSTSAAASVPTGAATGCAPSDFGGANAGTIVLVSRGACTFAAKATSAAAAGAVGVVIYNNGPGALNGTLGEGFTGDFSVVGIERELGLQLVDLVDDGLRLQLTTEVFRGLAETSNVLAQTKGGNADNVVMIGAHLDSVAAGPGINDNASGAGSVLEVAQQMAKTKTTNAVRFALWGAEESGLVGARHYVSSLSQAEQDEIALYLNFDMVASPNFVRFVYDGDDSVGDGNEGPAGSAQIEQAFISYFRSQGLASDPTDFSGRSDYGPFIAVGIPSGGLFTGAEGLKSEKQAEIYGGVAGAAYDPCYHQACDSLRQDFGADADKAELYRQLDGEYPLIGNVNMLALEQMSNAIAAVTLTYAYDTSSVNSVAGAPGKRKGIYTTGGSGSGGTSGTSDGSGGGLHEDHDHELDAA